LRSQNAQKKQEGARSLKWQKMPELPDKLYTREGGKKGPCSQGEKGASRVQHSEKEDPLGKKRRTFESTVNEQALISTSNLKQAGPCAASCWGRNSDAENRGKRNGSRKSDKKEYKP